MPIEGCKYGSFTFSSRNWLLNISPMSRDESSQNYILGNKYLSGQLFTCVSHFGNEINCGLRSQFQL